MEEGPEDREIKGHSAAAVRQRFEYATQLRAWLRNLDRRLAEKERELHQLNLEIAQSDRGAKALIVQNDPYGLASET